LTRVFGWIEKKMELDAQQAAPLGDSAPPPVDLAVKLKGPAKSLWRETIENMLRNPSAIVGLVMLTFLILVAIFAPIIATHDPELVLLDVPEEGASKRLAPCIHLLGCPGAGDSLVDINTAGIVTASGLNMSNTLMLAANGNEIGVWDVDENREFFTFEQGEPITAAAWSDNEQLILSASEGELNIWDINRRGLVRTLEDPENTDYVAWNGDGLRFLSGDDHQVTLWDGTLWSRVGTIEFEERLISTQWNDNGTLVMTASGNSVKLWNAFTATETASLEHDEPITSATYNSTSSRILTTSGNTLRVWHSSTYEEIETIEHNAPLNVAAWDDNVAQGVRRVVASTDDTAFVWDLNTDEQVLELPHGETITAIGSSPLATRIFTASDSIIRVWDAESGEQVVEIPLDAPAQSLHWMNSGAGIILASERNARVVKTTDFQYILGTDGNVRDEFSRLVYGARISLMVGFVTVTFAIIIGTFLGCVAGYLGGWADNAIMRVLDVLLAFPALILAIAIITVLGPGLVNALIALAIVTIPAYARVARAGVLSVKEEEFVTADRALGVSPVRTLFRRILPNILAPSIVQGTLGIGGAILEAAALSFIGLGAQPPTPEWGAMLAAERNQLFTAPHLVFIPGVAIMMVVLSFNLLGDGLRDALDPRLNR
jgi:peptide/nickel transport system permease protein